MYIKIKQFNVKIKDPGSALTHFIALLLCTPAAFFLLSKASPGALLPLAVFCLSMAGLYAASTVYHTFDISEKINLRLRKIDHMMIFVLIAGTYTPVCILALDKAVGIRLLALVWCLALLGIGFNIFRVNCPKWVSSLLYIGLGWVCVLAIGQIAGALSPSGFSWLLAGGIIYTAGGIIYALKLPLTNSFFPYFGSHELFHIFVMGGSFCHYIVMFRLAV